MSFKDAKEMAAIAVEPLGNAASNMAWSATCDRKGAFLGRLKIAEIEIRVALDRIAVARKFLEENESGNN